VSKRDQLRARLTGPQNLMLRPVWQGLGYDEKVGENYRLHWNGAMNWFIIEFSDRVVDRVR